MRSPTLMTLALCLTVVLGACAKQANSQAAATPAASSAPPVQWDYASNDPAKNPAEANKEATVPGYNP